MNERMPLEQPDVTTFAAAELTACTSFTTTVSVDK